jgi:hypothetical protein
MLCQNQETIKGFVFFNFMYLIRTRFMGHIRYNMRLMFVPCIIRHRRNNQQYALICTTPFYIPTSTFWQ